MTQLQQKFQLLESLLWEPENGYFLLDQHLQRLEKSANHFKFSISLNKINQALQALTFTFGSIKQKVRLTISNDGQLTLENQTLDQGILKTGALVGIARQPIEANQPLLYHKTTYRLPYKIALDSQPKCQDVLLWNQAGFITESTITNIVIDTPTGKITPPVQCGLLPGTFRAQLLAEGKIREELISLDDLRNTQTIFLINSVRRWIEIKKEINQDIWQVISN
jgi:branched-subunit amino acid aminotransferase/4-amino-4-deoxychorismate lyase